MKKKQNTSQLLENLKSAVSGLSDQEKEIFRDNLLSFLLFGDHTPTEAHPAKEPLKGISEDERALLRKLAAQTEELFRIMNKNNETEE